MRLAEPAATEFARPFRAGDTTQREYHGAQDGWLERAAAELPMGKLGQPDDAAALAVLLLSLAWPAAAVTGSIIDWDQEVIGAHD